MHDFEEISRIFYKPDVIPHPLRRMSSADRKRKNNDCDCTILKLVDEMKSQVVPERGANHDDNR